MQHVKKILWDSGPGAYTFYVPETTGNLDWRPVLQRRTTAGWRYFFVRTSCALNGRALTGVRSRTPVSFAPVRQPRLVPGHPDWRRGLGYATSKGVAMRPTISARPQQIQFPSLHPGDRVRSLHAGRVGAVVKVCADGCGPPSSQQTAAEPSAQTLTTAPTRPACKLRTRSPG
jgi:hypothetical protein